MRLAWCFPAVLVPVMVGSGAYGPSCYSCDCPVPARPPLQENILTTCDVPPTQLELTGPCSGGEWEASISFSQPPPDRGQVTFSTSGPGDCHVELSFANGFVYSTDLHFDWVWLACGSDPHACGQSLQLDQAEMFEQMVVNPCGDSGADATPVDSGAPGDAVSEAPADVFQADGSIEASEDVANDE